MISIKILRYIFGALYVMAGIAKALPQIEDVGEVLQKAAAANHDTWLAGLSQWLAGHALLMAWVSGIALLLSGLCYLFNRLLLPAVIGQCLMLAGFVTILLRAFPQIVLIDLVFLVVALLILWDSAKCKKSIHNLRLCDVRSKDNLPLPERRGSPLAGIITNNTQGEKMESRDISDYAGDAPVFPSKDFECNSVLFSETDNSPEEHIGDFDVVIVGGGISGLSAAWKLKEQKLLLLDQRDRFGGSARIEEREGLLYSSGASCFQLPTGDNEVSSLLRDLDLWNQWRSTEEDTLVIFDTNRLMKSMAEITAALLKQPKELLKPAVWGLTANLLFSALSGKPFICADKKLGDPMFAELFKYLNRFTSDSGKHPAIPWREGCGWTREQMEQFDSVSLHDLLFDPETRRVLPQELVPRHRFGSLVKDAVQTTLRVECLSIEDVSAYVGLHFLVGYLYRPLVTFPGGNGFIAGRISRRLTKNGRCKLMSGARACSVTQNEEGVKICFNQEGKRYYANAGALIWAGAKHSALAVIEGIPRVQKDAIGQIEHRDYGIACVYLKKAVLSNFFGGYVIEGDIAGKFPNSWCRSGVCLAANWKDPSYSRDLGVLTLLKPIAGSEDQGKLEQAHFRSLQQTAYGEVRDMLLATGNSPDLIEDIKLWRWPRGLVVSKVGQMKNDVFARASRPVGAIFFANQDSVGVGNLENAIWSGFHAAGQVLRQLQPWAGGAHGGLPRTSSCGDSELTGLH